MADPKPTLTPYDYRDAILVQDACNLSGVVRTFAEVMPKIRAEVEALGVHSTDAVNRHPIAVMFSSKIASLTGSDSMAAFSVAYDRCKKMSGEGGNG